MNQHPLRTKTVLVQFAPGFSMGSLAQVIGYLPWATELLSREGILPPQGTRWSAGAWGLGTGYQLVANQGD